MKKILFTISIACMILGCHKKETARLSNHLGGYLEKSQDKTLPFEQRISFNNKALELVLQSENQSDSLFFEYLFQIANTYYNLKEMQLYKTTSKRIVSYAQQVEDYANIAKAYEYIGDYYYNQQIKDSAYLYYLKAEKQYAQLHDKKNISKMMLNRASVQYYNGNLARSEISCLEALKSFKELELQNQNNENIYGAYNLLGVIANDQQEYYKALEYHNKAIEILTKDSSIVNRELRKANSLNNLGVVFQEQNRNKEALFYFYKAMENKDIVVKAPFLYATLLDNTAYSRFRLKDYKGVSNLFYKALRIREDLNIVPGIVMSKLHMSEYYQEQKDIKKAIQLASEAHDLAKTKGTDPRNVMLSLKQLQNIDIPLKEVYVIEYNHIADSLQQVHPEIHDTIVRELAEVEAQELAQQQNKEQNQAIAIWSGVILLVITLVGIILYQKSKNKKREAQQRKELELKEVQIQATTKVYDLMLTQKSNNNDITDDHYFVIMIQKRINEQRKYTSIRDYMDKSIVWDNVDHIIMMHLYNIIECCFEIINQNKYINLLNFELFQRKEKDIIILNINCNGVLETNTLQEITSSTKKMGGTITINYKKRDTSEIEVILDTKLVQRITSEL